MSLFSLHIGKSQDIASHVILPRHNAVGDIRTHIRVPGGVFAVSINDEQGDIVYAAVNAGPMEANGKIVVRWKVPKGGSYRAVLWKQKDRVTSKLFGVDDFTAHIKATCTKVTEFMFEIK